MRKLHEKEYETADALLTASAGAGYWLDKSTKILDLGCGSGSLVMKLRELGYDAYGFDIHDVVVEVDRKNEFFKFLENPQGETSNTHVSGDDFKLPWADNFFDVVFSTSVIEHVMDLNSFMRESSRVTKTSGFGYHLYPNKNLIIESHIYVPFASRIRNTAWMFLWALLGVRNDFQNNLSAREVVAANKKYFKDGLVYYSKKELFNAAAVYFDSVRFNDDLYYPGINDRVFRSNRIRALLKKGSLSEKLKLASQQLKMGSLILEKSKHLPIS